MSQRLLWMDFVRGICIVLVIFLHATPAIQRQGLEIPDAIAIINMAFDPFRIPSLMFLSGMLLHKSLSKPEREYVLGKFYQIFWPFLVWSMAVYAAEGRLTLEYILKTPISAPSVLWYLWFLCAYYIIALPIVRYKIPLLPIIFVSLIASGVLPSFLRMDRFAALFVFFLLGHYVMVMRFSMEGRWFLMLVGLCAALVGAIISVLAGPIKYNPLFIWVPCGLVLFVLWGAQFYRSHSVGMFIEWIGRNSIVFYAAHYPILIVSSELLSRSTNIEGALFYLSVVFVAIFLGAVLQVLRARYALFGALFDFRKLLRLRRSWRPV